MNPESRYKWSTMIDKSIKSGHPLTAAFTALYSYFPATIELMLIGTKKEKKEGLGLMALSIVGLPVSIITAGILASLQSD